MPTQESFQAHPPTNEIPQDDPRLQLVRSKVEQTWGSSVGETGYGDPPEVAQRLYDSLYNPNEAVAGIRDRQYAGGTQMPPLRERTQSILEETVEVPNAPDRAEFVQSITETIVRDVNVAETLLPGAREQIEELSDNGAEIIFWSAGEPRHQYHKLGAIGIGLRDSTLASTVEPPLEISQEYGEPIEVATAIATTKTTAENMARVAELAGDRQLVVIDDRTKNLTRFLEAFPAAKAIWVKFGAHANKTAEKLERGEELSTQEAIATGKIVPIDDIARVTDTINAMYEAGTLQRDKELAAAFDLDDTIIDNTRRRDLQHAAVLRVLQERDWI